MAAAAGYAVATHAALDPSDWNVVLVIIGLAGVVRATCKFSPDSPHVLDGLSLWAALLFPLYVAFQMVPLPGFLLRLLDPTRAEIAQALRSVLPASDFAPVSVAPLITIGYLSYLSGYTLIFLVIRDATRWFQNSLWAPAIPLIAIGGAEAAVGLAWRSTSTDPISGTYYSRDHFAGLLEMTLPFVAMYGLAWLSRGKKRGQLVAASAIKGSVLLALAAAMFSAVILSQSKMGFFSMLGSMLAMGVVGLAARLPGRKKWFAIAGLVVLAALSFVFLPTIELTAQFGTVASDPTAEGRWPLAKDTLHLIAAYPVFGIGLGAYYPGLLRYQTTALNAAVINAHNDYLQMLSELGVLGFLIPATLMCCVFARALRTALSARTREARFLGLACTGGFAALLIHSLADFNLYVPANAMIFAWIAGVSAGLPVSLRDENRKIPKLTPSLLRGFVLAVGCLAILYAGAWLLFLHSYRDDPAPERLFCRFGICDSLRAAGAVVNQHGGDIAAVPQADLLMFLGRDPANPFPWEDLGEALRRTGRTTEARSCFATALTLGPNIPNVLNRAARFHFGLAENATAFALMARAIQGDPAGAGIALDEYERWKVPLGDVIRYGLPAVPEAWRSYMHRLMDQERTSEVIAVWNATVSRGYSDDRLANEVVEFLIRHKSPESAQQAWALYAAGRSPGYAVSNYVFNGDFESPSSGVRFDWKIEPRSGAAIDFDKEAPHSGARSLRIQFDGTQNLDAAGLSQDSWLKPGWYRLQAYVRAKDLSTNEGVSFNVRDETSRVNFTTEAVLGSTDWKFIQQDFRVPPGTGLVRMSVIRKPSLKFDSLLRGILWIDQVNIRRHNDY